MHQRSSSICFCMEEELAGRDLHCDPERMWKLEHHLTWALFSFQVQKPKQLWIKVTQTSIFVEQLIQRQLPVKMHRGFLKTACPMKIFENSWLKWSVHSKTINWKMRNSKPRWRKAHAFNPSEKCSKLENRVFSLHKFICDEDIAFYTGFSLYAAFMATYTYLQVNQGKAVKTFHIGVLF